MTRLCAVLGLAVFWFASVGAAGDDPPFRPEAGKFPPLEKSHAYRGELRFNDYGSDWFAVAPNLDVTVTKAGEYRGQLRYDNGSILIQKYEPMRADMTAGFKIVDGKVMFDREVNWMFETEPEPRMNGRNIKVPRGRVLGGSSSINGLLYIRGQREDYDDWRDLGNPGWAFADCLPYFKKAEDQCRGADEWHGVGGPLSVSDIKDRHPLADSFIDA